MGNDLNLISNVFVPLNVILLSSFDFVVCNHTVYGGEEGNSSNSTINEGSIMETKSTQAIQIILAMYATFVVLLILIHCGLNRRETYKKERSREAKENADFGRKAEEERKKRSVRKGQELLQNLDNAHYERHV